MSFPVVQTHFVIITGGPSISGPHSILLALVAPVIPLTALKVGESGGCIVFLPACLCFVVVVVDDDVRLG